MCTADMATIVHSDICSLLNGETLGKTKKTRKTKGSYPDPSKTIENNQKNQKNQRSQQPWQRSEPHIPLLSRKLLILLTSLAFYYKNTKFPR